METKELINFLCNIYLFGWPLFVFYGLVYRHYNYYRTEFEEVAGLVFLGAIWPLIVIYIVINVGAEKLAELIHTLRGN